MVAEDNHGGPRGKRKIAMPHLFHLRIFGFYELSCFRHRRYRLERGVAGSEAAPCGFGKRFAWRLATVTRKSILGCRKGGSMINADTVIIVLMICQITRMALKA
ncbi:hypothetical protein [Gellertiella hungarica]|uniref:Uncharacterized protein n=1 Tax=Gellertiella hungarica TaxID=1572859 RepID=A0A7W6JAM3_9HYPH|nr:hypothetical protein [Gellertiella hungarica]MBB4066948.1 hypothetical protein [Gellertiella hungarica]